MRILALQEGQPRNHAQNDSSLALHGRALATPARPWARASLARMHMASVVAIIGSAPRVKKITKLQFHRMAFKQRASLELRALATCVPRAEGSGSVCPSS